MAPQLVRPLVSLFADVTLVLRLPPGHACRGVWTRSEATEELSSELAIVSVADVMDDGQGGRMEGFIILSEQAGADLRTKYASTGTVHIVENPRFTCIRTWAGDHGIQGFSIFSLFPVCFYL